MTDCRKWMLYCTQALAENELGFATVGDTKENTIRNGVQKFQDVWKCEKLDKYDEFFWNNVKWNLLDKGYANIPNISVTLHMYKLD